MNIRIHSFVNDEIPTEAMGIIAALRLVGSTDISNEDAANENVVTKLF